MYPSLPIGPLSLPTAPFLALLAAWLGMNVLARAGSRLGLHSDHLWNLGTLALVAGIIVARLWHVVQFWGIYRSAPELIVSLRPGALDPWAGGVAALCAGYGYLIRRRLEPLPVLGALALASLAAGAVLEVSAYLTGNTLGIPASVPWALPFFDEMRHPVALYRALGMAGLAVALLVGGDLRRPGRLLLQAGFGYGVVRLVADGFLADAATIGPLRWTQLGGLGLALVCGWLLARTGQDSEKRTIEGTG